MSSENISIGSTPFLQTGSAVAETLIDKESDLANEEALIQVSDTESTTDSNYDVDIASAYASAVEEADSGRCDVIEISDLPTPNCRTLPYIISSDVDDDGKIEPDEEAVKEKREEKREEEYGLSGDDLSKTDYEEIQEIMEEALASGTTPEAKEVSPGITQTTYGDWTETEITLYDGLTYDELDDDQKA